MQPYVVRSKIDKTKEQESTLYYGVPVISGKITLEDISREICEQSSLTEADVISTIHSVGNIMERYLAFGYNVNLEGIGTFSVSASSVGCATPEECTPAKVKPQRVCFKADRKLRSVLGKIKYKVVSRNKTR